MEGGYELTQYDFLNYNDLHWEKKFRKNYLKVHTTFYSPVEKYEFIFHY